jgi:crotonobetainyl-CoA:carnitine CoA-transferase CaiB-like acyl-CoA transferase
MSSIPGCEGRSRVSGTPKALDGIRVLDLIDGPGAYGPKLLVSMGADVVRVEKPAGGLDRQRQSPWTTPEQPLQPGTHFVHYNAGKRGITLDIAQPAGRALLERLLPTASIVFDNGALVRAGFSIDELISRKPAMVIVSVTPFGLKGPHAGWSGSDLIVQAMSGMISFFGYEGERPMRFGAAQAEQMCGLAAAFGALVAWHGRCRTGDGEFVDIAMDQVCSLTTFQMANASLYHQFGFVRRRTERTKGLPLGLYEALDGYFAFNAWRDVDGTIALLERFQAGTGLRELYDSVGAEAFQRDSRARGAVSAFIIGRTRAELTELVQSAGLMGLPVHDVADLRKDPFLNERAFFVDIDVPGFPAAIPDAGVPVRMLGTPLVPGRRPPLLGEHNAELFGNLGLSLAELDALRKEGVV